MNTKWIAGFAVAIIVLAGGYAVSRQEASNQPAPEPASAVTMEEKNTATDAEQGAPAGPMAQSGTGSNPVTETTGDMPTQDKKTTEREPGMYKDYSPAALAEAAKNGGKTVLFFWAAWCPYCKEADADFSSNSGKIPSGVTVLKVNYDTEKDLKTNYGVTYQHTFVQVDASGNQVTKWNGGGLKELTANIK